MKTKVLKINLMALTVITLTLLAPTIAKAEDLVQFKLKVKPTQDDTCVTNYVSAESGTENLGKASTITQVGSPSQTCSAPTSAECDGKHTSWPVSGFIGQGPYTSPPAGSHYGDTAPAVDIYPEVQGTIGDPVYATICGTIGHYGEDPNDCGGTGGCDIYAQIVTSNFQTYFVHLDSLADGLSRGSEVKKGDLIGYRGQTGQAASGPHTHYMIKDGNNANLSKDDFNKELPPYNCPTPGGILTCHFAVKSIYRE